MIGEVVVVRRRRDWSDDFKRRVVADASAPGASVSRVALANDVNANLVFTWRKNPRFSSPAATEFLPVEVRPGRGCRPSAVVIEGSTDIPAPAPCRISKEIHIRLSCGAELQCGNDVDEAVLLKVLRALRRSA